MHPAIPSFNPVISVWSLHAELADAQQKAEMSMVANSLLHPDLRKHPYQSILNDEAPFLSIAKI
jgi:hypothetical protein